MYARNRLYAAAKNSKYEISLNMKGGTLKQGTTEIPLYYGSTEDKDTCVRVMRNETIPAHSEIIEYI